MLARPHASCLGGFTVNQSHYAQANCRQAGDRAQPSQSGAGAAAPLSWCARLVGRPSKAGAKRRCEHPGEGADVSGAGLEKRLDDIPSREQLVQEKGLIHTCSHPLTRQRCAQPLRRGFPVENEETEPLKMTDALFLLLGITSFLQAAPFPFPSPQAAAKSTAMLQHRLLSNGTRPCTRGSSWGKRDTTGGDHSGRTGHPTPASST